MVKKLDLGYNYYDKLYFAAKMKNCIYKTEEIYHENDSQMVWYRL